MARLAVLILAVLPLAILETVATQITTASANVANTGVPVVGTTAVGVEIIATTNVPVAKTTVAVEAETTKVNVATTKLVEVTTQAPVEITTKPAEITTQAPVEVTTEPAEVTTQAPVEVTTKPAEVTTQAPVEVTTEAAEVPTQAPVEVTTKPVQVAAVVTTTVATQAPVEVVTTKVVEVATQKPVEIETTKAAVIQTEAVEVTKAVENAKDTTKAVVAEVTTVKAEPEVEATTKEVVQVEISEEQSQQLVALLAVPTDSKDLCTCIGGTPEPNCAKARHQCVSCDANHLLITVGGDSRCKFRKCSVNEKEEADGSCTKYTQQAKFGGAAKLDSSAMKQMTGIIKDGKVDTGKLEDGLKAMLSSAMPNVVNVKVTKVSFGSKKRRRRAAGLELSVEYDMTVASTKKLSAADFQKQMSAASSLIPIAMDTTVKEIPGSATGYVARVEIEAPTGSANGLASMGGLLFGFMMLL